MRLCACVCACVYVCEGEREKKRGYQAGEDFEPNADPLNVNKKLRLGSCE